MSRPVPSPHHVGSAPMPHTKGHESPALGAITLLIQWEMVGPPGLELERTGGAALKRPGDSTQGQGVLTRRCAGINEPYYV